MFLFSHQGPIAAHYFWRSLGLALVDWLARAVCAGAPRVAVRALLTVLSIGGSSMLLLGDGAMAPSPFISVRCLGTVNADWFQEPKIMASARTPKDGARARSAMIGQPGAAVLLNAPAAPISLAFFDTQEGLRFRALGMVESGDDDMAIGRDGEISRFQITPRVWREYTTLPLNAGTNPFTALNVARAIMHTRVSIFETRFHRKPNDDEWYMLWNRPAEVARFKISGFRDAALKARAVRFANFLGTLQNKQKKGRARP